jgi:hypothetical protein
MTWFKTFNFVCKTYTILFLLFESYMLLFPMFMLAWSNGQMTGIYDSVLRINIYGEASIEIIWWLISLPFIMYGTFGILKDVINVWVKK